jgi:hypothetical protein
LRDLGLEEELAVSQLDCVAVAPPGDAFADAAAAEAREILGRIGARAFLDQLDELLATRASAAGRAHAVPSRSASSGSAVAAPELAPGS